MPNIKLVALDLDGTLFNNESIITQENKAAIRQITDQGIYVVISTGRPFSGLPFEQIKDTGIRYAITTNGSSVYEIPTKTCIFEAGMEPAFILPIVDFLQTKDIHIDAFIDGIGYSPIRCLEIAKKLPLPESIKQYVLNTRERVEDFHEFLSTQKHPIQKMTLNFYRDENDVLVDREAAKTYLNANPNILCVCGGYNNLEFTKAGITKGIGLSKLAEHLNIPLSDTMAIGDTENDMAILEAAGLGIAMGNATPEVKALADDITLSNEENGVAAAIYKYISL